MIIRYTVEAHRDLVDAIAYLSKEAPEPAGRLADRLLATIERLAREDFEGPATRLTTGEIVRSWPVPPYRVYYQRSREAFLVVRIYHQARPPIAR